MFIQHLHGLHRADGKVGTANYWLFVPLVFCENRNLKIIQDTLNKALGYQKQNEYIQFTNELLGDSLPNESLKSNRVFKNIDGIRFLYHDGGCGGTRRDYSYPLSCAPALVNLRFQTLYSVSNPVSIK
ncbi:MAG: UxaA family hydrolase [Cyclobacteriaceae bacterium]